MAPLSSAASALEPNQISADDVLQFLEEHGFFYQGNAVMGERVDQLFREGLARSDEAKLERFKPTLLEDMVSSASDSPCACYSPS